MVLRWASESGSALCCAGVSLGVVDVCTWLNRSADVIRGHVRCAARRREDVADVAGIARNMDGHLATGYCDRNASSINYSHGNSLLFITSSVSYTHKTPRCYHRSSVMGQSRSYHSTRNQMLRANPYLSRSRSQHHSLWKTWRGGPTVRRWHFTVPPSPSRPSTDSLHRALRMCVCVPSQRQRIGATEEALHEARQVLTTMPSARCPDNDSHTHA